MPKSPSSTSSSEAVGRLARRFAVFVLLLGLSIGLGFPVRLQLEAAALASLATHQIVIAGDSHAEASLDPAPLGDAMSIAQRAEPYVATHAKLVRLLRARPEVRVVVLSFSPHNLSAFNDAKFHRPEFASEMFKRYGLLLTPASLAGLDVSWSIYARSLFFRGLLLRPSDVGAVLGVSALPYIGRYRPKEGCRLWLRPADGAIRRHFYDGAEPFGFSRVSERSLLRIAELSARRGIELLLVATPLHPEYKARVPAEHWENYRRVAGTLERRPHVRFIDLSDLPLPRNDYYDYDHVNARGAAVLGRRLAPLVGATLRHRGAAAGLGEPPTAGPYPSQNVSFAASSMTRWPRLVRIFPKLCRASSVK